MDQEKPPIQHTLRIMFLIYNTTALRRLTC